MPVTCKRFFLRARLKERVSERDALGFFNNENQRRWNMNEVEYLLQRRVHSSELRQ